jgi:type IV pilus assembly protein PilO
MANMMDAIYKLPKSKKVTILVVLICVVIGLYAYAFFMPQQKELSGLKNQLSNLTRELSESKAISKDLEKFKKQVEELNIELTNALTQLPNEKEIPEILRNISALGKESRLNSPSSGPNPKSLNNFMPESPSSWCF